MNAGVNAPKNVRRVEVDMSGYDATASSAVSGNAFPSLCAVFDVGGFKAEGLQLRFLDLRFRLMANSLLISHSWDSRSWALNN